MTEEQIKQKFKETYPDFMRGDEPLSPYFDIWEYGIEIATKELQEENLKLEAKVRTLEIEQNYCLPNCSKIADLENKLSNVSYQLEGREVELKELNKKLSQAEADYDKMFWQKNEIISNLQEQLNKNPCVRNTEWYCNDCLEQLIKAKDFILKLTTYLEGHTNYDFEYELIKEVKQFLKESEVEE